MRKRMVFVACGIIVVILLAFKVIPLIWDTWSLAPTKSSPNELKLVSYKRFTLVQPVIITFRHCVNDTRINDYVLEVKNGVRLQETQSYRLPQLEEGMVEVNVKSEDNSNISFTISYDQAHDLYKKGLLIYLTDNGSEYSIVDGKEFYDRYVYFVSGSDEICYFKEAYSSDWSLATDAPTLKKLRRNEPQPYIVWYSGWKENEWVVLPKKID